MNQLETELLKRRVLKPIENWDKIVGPLGEICAEGLRGGRYLVPEPAQQAIVNLYDEVWEEPEKIAFFKDTTINLCELVPGLPVAAPSYLKPGLDNEHERLLVISKDSVLSYITIKDYRFRIALRQWGRVTERDAVVLPATTNVLTPSILNEVLGSNRSRAEKLEELNYRLIPTRLPRLRGNNLDEMQLDALSHKQSYEMLLSRDKNNPHLPVLYGRMLMLGYKPDFEPPAMEYRPPKSKLAALSWIKSWTRFSNKWLNDMYISLNDLCLLACYGYLEIKCNKSCRYIRASDKAKEAIEEIKRKERKKRE